MKNYDLFPFVKSPRVSFFDERVVSLTRPSFHAVLASHWKLYRHKGLPSHLGNNLVESIVNELLIGRILYKPNNISDATKVFNSYKLQLFLIYTLRVILVCSFFSMYNFCFDNLICKKHTHTHTQRSFRTNLLY